MKEFKLIVAGGRDFDDEEKLSKVLFSMAEDTEDEISIVSGMAHGADRLGYDFAVEHHIKVYCFYADWKQFERSAGFKRNEQMGNFADGLLAFHDGCSRGTLHMIDYMSKLGKPVIVVNY